MNTYLDIYTENEVWKLYACGSPLPQAWGALAETHTPQSLSVALWELMHIPSNQSIFIQSTYMAWNLA